VRRIPIRPFGLERLRSAAPLGWAGLALWVWATAVVPAVHAALHAQEAVDETGIAPNRQRIQAIIDEVLGRAVDHGQRHSHSHDHGAPGQGPHGKGSLEHLNATFAAVAVFVPPSGFQAVETAPMSPAPTAPALVTSWRLPRPRGPPSLLSAALCS
jgi:hypothetical protein